MMILQTGYYWVQYPNPDRWAIEYFDGQEKRWRLNRPGYPVTTELFTKSILKIARYIGIKPPDGGEPKVVPPVLTKENFWNDLHEKYPGGMAWFCQWVDEYKIKNPAVFASGLKFHDLPTAMQVGVFIEFTMSHGQFCFFPDGPDYLYEMTDAIQEWFSYEEDRAMTEKQVYQ